MRTLAHIPASAQKERLVSNPEGERKQCLVRPEQGRGGSRQPEPTPPDSGTGADITAPLHTRGHRQRPHLGRDRAGQAEPSRGVNLGPRGSAGGGWDFRADAWGSLRNWVTAFRLESLYLLLQLQNKGKLFCLPHPMQSRAAPAS